LRQRTGFYHTGKEQPLVDALARTGRWLLFVRHGLFLHLLLERCELCERRIRIDRLFLARRLGLEAQRLRCPAIVAVVPVIAIVTLFPIAAILTVVAFGSVALMLRTAAVAVTARPSIVTAGFAPIAIIPAFAIAVAACLLLTAAVAAIALMTTSLALTLLAATMIAMAASALALLVVAASAKTPKQNRLRLDRLGNDDIGTR
jgi:hypothetical protein